MHTIFTISDILEDQALPPSGSLMLDVHPETLLLQVVLIVALVTRTVALTVRMWPFFVHKVKDASQPTISYNHVIYIYSCKVLSFF